MAKGVPGTAITIIVALSAIGGIYYFISYLMSGKSQGTPGNNNNFTGVAPEQYPNSTGGGRRKKSGNKKSPIMSTTGVYLLLGAVLVGYITSKIV